MKRIYSVMAVVLWLALSLAFVVSCDDGSAGLPDDSSNGDEDNFELCGCPNGCGDDGSCLPDPCNDDVDCPPGEICIEGRCQPSVPTGEGDKDEEIIVETDNPVDGDEAENPTDGDDDTSVPDGDFDYEYDIEFETDIPHEDDDPWITVSTRRLDFGAVPLNSSRIKSLTVTNIGEGDLEVDDIFLYFDQTPLEIFVVHPAMPITLTKDGTFEISAEFIPTDMEPDFNMMIIHSNDPSEPNLGVEIITDIKESASASIDPVSIEFGTVRLGHYEEQMVISNNSGVELYVSRIELEGDSPEITLSGLPEDIDATNPILIEHRESFSFDVNYDPTLADGIEDTATLSIETNDETVGTFFVPISGTPCEPVMDVAPTVIDYTDVAFGDTATRCATVTNAGCWDLDIESIELVDDGDGAYAFDPFPTSPLVLAGEETLDICVRYIPQSVGDGVGEVLVRGSDPLNPEVTILLSSTVLPPDIDCTPNPLDFGRVPLETMPVEQITCRNLSPGRLEITRYALDRNPGLHFSLENTPQTILEYNESTTFDISYFAVDEVVDEGNLMIETNDPDEIKIDIPLLAEAYDPNTCPVALIQLVSPPIDAILSGDTVQLDGSGSSDPDQGDSISRYIWTIEAKPSGSLAQIANPNDVQPAIDIDKAGDYTIKLEVKDQEGELSCEPDFLSFNAGVPPADIGCTPVPYDFGSHPFPNSVSGTLNCRNFGGSELTISNYEMQSPAPGIFEIYGTPPANILPGQPFQVNMVYRPDDVGADNGVLKIHSNDPDEAIYEIALSGGGYYQNHCPTAVASITSPPITDILQGDTVQLDGSASYDSDAGDGISAYIWVVDSAPSGSTSQPVTPGAAQPTFVVDKPGSYVITLQVKDNYNEISCNTASVSFTAVAPPDIDCGPNPLNMGTIEEGQVRSESIICRNLGGSELSIGSVALSANSDNEFTITGSSGSAILAPFQTKTIDITFAPQSQGSYSATLYVDSDDPDEARAFVDIVGQSYASNNCPVARLEATSPDLQYLKPLDTIQLDGSNSYDSDPGDSISEYIWSVMARPSGSTSQIAGQGPDTTFFVDLAGTYTFKLEVKDSHGMLSCVADTLTVEAIPREIIHVQLVWSTDETDMDLHMTRPGGNLWSGTDCYFSNCTNGLDWSSYGEPSLDIDRRYGYGPENINLNDPGDGLYTVYVHYWATHGVTADTTVTVRIYIYGRKVGEWENVFSRSDHSDRWPVATIEWSSSANDATVDFLGYDLEPDSHSGSRRSSLKGLKKPGE